MPGKSRVQRSRAGKPRGKGKRGPGRPAGRNGRWFNTNTELYSAHRPRPVPLCEGGAAGAASKHRQPRQTHLERATWPIGDSPPEQPRSQRAVDPPCRVPHGAGRPPARDCAWHGGRSRARASGWRGSGLGCPTGSPARRAAGLGIGADTARRASGRQASLSCHGLGVPGVAGTIRAPVHSARAQSPTQTWRQVQASCNPQHGRRDAKGGARCTLHFKRPGPDSFGS